MKRRTISIDGAKLTAELKKRGVTKAKASEEIGMSVNYLAACTHSGIISAVGSIALQKVYGIEPEDYALTDEPEVVEEPPADDDKLYRIIYMAVYNAMKQALNE